MTSEVFQPADTLVLLNNVTNSWDRVRTMSFDTLQKYPVPLPGIASLAAVRKLVLWGLKVASSPRNRDTEAGSLIVRVVFRKYVVEAGWFIDLQEATEVSCAS